ncbi:MAG: right-handed parallel beta-helix repeat-containing protein [Rhodospirillales bacterium]|nr:right-handed parallel beta-helix repeat-containing protein [Rhodospirillales bacterium]
MPTIDQLGAALAVADTDVLPISQGGVAVKVSRAQLVAGMQPLIALAQWQVLGRGTAGTGDIEALTLGGNLVLSAGTLSANPPPFAVTALPAGATPSGGDLLPVGQGGRTVAVPYAQFMTGLSGVPGVDISNLEVSATGGTVARRVADAMGDAVAIEAFGAKGDGVSDDSAALAAAIASGQPVRLGPKTYVVNGQFTIIRAGTTLLGVPGLSVLRRGAQAGNGAWIAVQADHFRADGIVFDANKAAVALDSWGVLVTSVCLDSDFHRCAFLNAAGATLGSGLVIQASDPANCRHVVRDCEFYGNSVHGLWIQACAGVLVSECRAHDNGQYGIVADFNDITFKQKVHLVQIVDNQCWNNVRGISVGNYNVTNGQPPVWGNANPDAILILVKGNVCHDNSVYGIAASGSNLVMQGNLLSNNGAATNGGAAILANLAWSRVAGNMITGPAAFGIDCGGSINADVAENHVTGAVNGINCGGGTNVRVIGNAVHDCTSWAVSVNNVETDIHGENFGVSCTNLAITGNWISMTVAGSGGIVLRDGPQNVLVSANNFVGSVAASACLAANTDTILVEANRFNFTARFICNTVVLDGLQSVVFPDIADSIMVTAAPAGVQAMLSSYQAQSLGQISFIKVTAGGAGYTHASVTVGGAGSGATANAVISKGALVGIVVVTSGTGYGPIGGSVPVTITGDGAGASAAAYAGPPLPEERRLKVRCNAAVRFYRAASQPLQENWTLSDIDVPANSDIEWTASWGSWRAGYFAPFDYLGADGLGGAILRSAGSGDVALHPAGTGHVRLLSDSEATGCLSSVGRGSPEGVLVAPAGSDYRNLDGGAGATWWVKRSGTGNTGWFAVA